MQHNLNHDIANPGIELMLPVVDGMKSSEAGWGARVISEAYTPRVLAALERELRDCPPDLMQDLTEGAQRLTGLLLGQACRAVKKCVDDLPFAMTGDVLDSMADSYQSVAQCSHRGQGRAEALRGILQRHVKDDGQSIGDDVAEVFRERGQRLRRELQAAMEATQKKLLNRVGAALQQAEAAQTKPSRGAMVAVAKDIKDLRDSVRRA